MAVRSVRRMGAKKGPFTGWWWPTPQPADGRFIESLGYYNPISSRRDSNRRRRPSIGCTSPTLRHHRRLLEQVGVMGSSKRKRAGRNWATPWRCSM